MKHPMEYIYISYLTHEEDDPAESYVELDETHRERRRVDLYDNGMCFAYGGIYGYSEALSKTPYRERWMPGRSPARPLRPFGSSFPSGPPALWMRSFKPKKQQCPGQLAGTLL